MIRVRAQNGKVESCECTQWRDEFRVEDDEDRGWAGDAVDGDTELWPPPCRYEPKIRSRGHEGTDVVSAPDKERVAVSLWTPDDCNGAFVSDLDPGQDVVPVLIEDPGLLRLGSVGEDEARGGRDGQVRELRVVPAGRAR